MTTNEVTSSGLTTQELPEIISELNAAFQSIYGADINLEQNSPDGQLIGILAQLKRDLLELITQVYNSFDPDTAEGSALDARVALNGISRNGGTYTITPVSITVDRAMTLYGLDQNIETIFTVEDSAGNQFYIEETQAIGGAGTASYNFRAKDLGAIQVALNDITSQVTVVVGVTAVNNPDPAGEIGVAEESDAELRIRRQVSTAIASTGAVPSILSNILNIEAVSDAYVWENYTGSPDIYSVPGHSIWAVVEGGADQSIGEVIYAKRSAGCGMVGSETVNVLQPNGEYFVAQFDRPIYVPLSIHFSLTEKVPGVSYDEATVKAALAAGLDFKIFEEADAASVTNLLATIVPQFIPTGVEVSINDINWFEIIDPTDPQHKFTVSAANITIIP